jgi:hypothetical protein
LEIKTTCGHERTAFWLTRREVDIAAERTEIYRFSPSSTRLFILEVEPSERLFEQLSE